MTEIAPLSEVLKAVDLSIELDFELKGTLCDMAFLEHKLGKKWTKVNKRAYIVILIYSLK